MAQQVFLAPFAGFIFMSLENFNDWRWQLRNSTKTLEQLRAKFLNSRVHAWLLENFKPSALPFSVTPYFLSLMDDDENCPLFLQVISSQKESVKDLSDRRDPLGEEERKRVPHLVHRYP